MFALVTFKNFVNLDEGLVFKVRITLFKALYFLAWISFRLLAFLLRAEDLSFFFFGDLVACVPTLVSREKEKLGSRFRLKLLL